MEIDTDLLNKIYNQMADEKSKEIFKNRLMYSISEDSRWVFENFKYVEDGKIYRTLKSCVLDKKMVIFGAGIRGEALYRNTRHIVWKCFVDNCPKRDKIDNIPVLRWDEFIKSYDNEYIFITPKNKNAEIYKQLIEAGIPEKQIINTGELQDQIIKKQYFDLEDMHPNENEIFLDVCGYDGMTSVYFSQWASKYKKIYIFEPDENNIEKCYYNIEKYNIRCELIGRGVWSEDTILKFEANSNESSQISNNGEYIIPVTTIDKACAGKGVSFIKMDIEGAEEQALIGAKQTIINNRPKLAICVYHKLDDIWKIPNIILKYNSSYKLFLRHYTYSENDTVLYAVP